jgi:hypothetical protein
MDEHVPHARYLFPFHIGMRILEFHGKIFHRLTDYFKTSDKTPPQVFVTFKGRETIFAELRTR